MPAFPQPVLQYWRTSLADGALGEGKFSQRDRAAFIPVPAGTLRSGILPKADVERLFKSPTAAKTVSVRLWPLVTARKTSHGAIRAGGLPDIVAPVVTEASVNRDGRITPLRNTIARDLLTPLKNGEFSIGTVEALDTFLTEYPLDQTTIGDAWQTYLAHCRKMVDAVAPGWPRGDTDYHPIGSGFLELAEDGNATVRQILDLYDTLLADQPDTTLLSQFAMPQAKSTKPDHSIETHLARRLGHSNPKFPLALHQRQVLAWLDAAVPGEIIAVNGPPGTGKTTMLLSAVAGLWVRAALQGADPPIIVAASSNNQAVTNIIDAFGKDFARGSGVFAGRWLPDIASFGIFLASNSRKHEASQRYQTEDFQTELENESYVLRAKAAYLKAAQAAFPTLPNPDVATVVAALQARIRTEAGNLSAVDSAAHMLATAQADIDAVLGDDPVKARAELADKLTQSQQNLIRPRAAISAFDQHQASESSLSAILSFLSPIEKKRTLRARLAIGILADNLDGLRKVAEIEAKLRAVLLAAEQAHHQSQADHDHAERLHRDHSDAVVQWHKTTAAFDTQATPFNARATLDDLADTGFRFHLFLLATHYWEGRWLMAMDADLARIKTSHGKKGRTTVVSRWQRRMMLTPCAVATFASLPGKMTYSRNAGGEFSTEYLLNFIDLLIVDEAGQVLPEVAGASFALAKTALVIGDTQQIAPITSVPLPVDIGNLRNCGLLPSDSDAAAWDALKPRGLCSTTGSAMRLAQAACQISPYPNLEKGFHLFEHRRSYDEIISFSNALCYKGTLRPMRGTAPENAQLPALGYLHIDGRALRSGSSHSNIPEAQTIAAWLAANRAAMEARYGQKLEQIVGVVTPFGRQAQEIRAACASQKIVIGGPDGMTIGTVHALQGAERPVVIFSPVYSKHAGGGFIDASPSMLNVTVSRAKDSCLVFGDMDSFSTAPTASSRAVLASFLFANSQNALAFDPAPRADLQQDSGQFQTLSDAADHDAFLLATLASDARHITIVSPWVIVRTMQNAGILDALDQSAARGAQIDIFVDPLLNTDLNAQGQTHLAAAETAFAQIGVRLHKLPQLHSKIVAVDSDRLCIGSYNWLSAARSGDYARHETSFVYQGAHLEGEIRAITESLRSRQK